MMPCGAKHRVEEAGIQWPQAIVRPRTAFTAAVRSRTRLAGGEQRESLLLFDRAVRDRSEDLRIGPGVPRQLLSIALAVAVRDHISGVLGID